MCRSGSQPKSRSFVSIIKFILFFSLVSLFVTFVPFVSFESFVLFALFILFDLLYQNQKGCTSLIISLVSLIFQRHSQSLVIQVQVLIPILICPVLFLFVKVYFKVLPVLLNPSNPSLQFTKKELTLVYSLLVPMITTYKSPSLSLLVSTVQYPAKK